MAYEIREYLAEDGESRFARRFESLNAPAALKVRTVLARMEAGNLSNAKGVGGGVLEQRIDFGPGYRVYFGIEGRRLIVLLCGGTKKRQSRDIETAKAFWADYKSRRRKER